MTNKKLIKTTLSDGTVIELPEKKHLKMANYNIELCDYDYLHKLNEEQKNYLQNFNDEYYNGCYSKYSVFLPKKLSKKEEEDMQIELEKENEKRKRNNLKRKKSLKIIETLDEYQILLQKRRAKSAKNHRIKDYFNKYSNESQGNFFAKTNNKLVIDSKFKTQNNKNFFDYNILEEKEEEYNDRYYFEDKEKRDKELLLFYIKENKVENFLIIKIIELITTKIKVKRDVKDTLINVLEHYQELSSNKKISKIECYKALYRIFSGLKLIMNDNEDEDVVMLKKIFDNYIYNKIAFKKDLQKGD